MVFSPYGVFMVLSRGNLGVVEVITVARRRALAAKEVKIVWTQ
jgi:hypothetical protein